MVTIKAVSLMESIMVLEYWFKLMGLHMRVNFIKA